MSFETQRLEAALRPLIDDHVITSGQAEAMVRMVASGVRRRDNWLVETLGYVGGALMLVGVGVLVSISWERFGRAAWVAICALVTVVLLAAGLLMAGVTPGARRDVTVVPGVRRRVAGVLLALASAAAAITVGVGVDNQPPYLAPAIGTAVAIATYALLRTVPGVVAAAVLSLATALFALSDLRHLTTVVPLGALMIIVLGVVWVVAGLTGLVVPRSMAFGAGVGFALFGGQIALDGPGPDGWGYALTAAVALACVALYRVWPATVFLLGGVVGVSLALPEFLWDVTNGAGGVAAILIIAGAVLLASSGVGMALRSRVVRSDPGGPGEPDPGRS